jgi:hypothetical protein
MKFSGKNLTGFQNLSGLKEKILWKKPDRFPKPVRFKRKNFLEKT